MNTVKVCAVDDEYQLEQNIQEETVTALRADQEKDTVYDEDGEDLLAGDPLMPDRLRLSELEQLLEKNRDRPQRYPGRLLNLKRMIAVLKVQIEDGSASVQFDDYHGRPATDAGHLEVLDKKQGGKSSVTEEGGISDAPTCCPAHDADATWTSDEFDAKWSDEWEVPDPNFEKIPWHNDMPEWLEEEIEEDHDEPQALSAPDSVRMNSVLLLARV